MISHEGCERVNNHACSHRSTGVATQSLDELFFTSKRSLHDAVIRADLPRLSRLLPITPCIEESTTTTLTTGRKGTTGTGIGIGGIDVNAVDGAGYAPLLYARKGAVIDHLLRAGADPGVVTPEGGRTLLHRMAGSGDVGIVRDLLRLGMIASQVDRDGVTPRELALRSGHHEVVDVIDSFSPS